MSDSAYNITKQLTKELEFLWHVDGYIRDAEKEGNQECAKVFKEIKDDEVRHARKLKDLLLMK